MNFTQRSRWALPLTGMVLVASAGVGAPQLLAGAPTAGSALDAPATPALRIDEPQDTVGSAEIPRWPLSDDAPATHQVEVNQPFVITISPDSDVTAFDGILRYDDQALEFAGAASSDPGSTLFQNDDADAAVALVVFPDAAIDDATPVASMEARFIAEEPGLIEVAFDVSTEIDRSDVSTPSDTILRAVIEVTDPESPAPLADAPAPDAEPTGDDRQRVDTPPVAVDTDVDDDGEVTELDITELKIGWDEQLSAGGSCDLDTPTMGDLDLDLDGDGCLGVTDFAAVADVAPTFAQSAPLAEAGSGSIFAVTKLTDEPDTNLNDNKCVATTGGCSLRAAIAQANATTGPNRIEFNITDPEPHTIELGSKLPTINDTSGGLVIDGYSQVGATPNTDPTVSNATIKIAVKSKTYVDGRPAFAITSANNTIRGLAVYDSFHSFLLTGTGATGNLLAGNFIGTDPAGAVARVPAEGNDAGVKIEYGASANRIGTPALADRNVIAGSRSWGVRVEQVGSNGNIIQNNLFGMKPDGTNRIPSRGGVDVQFGPKNTLIGGNGARERNVLSGHTDFAIDLSHRTFDNLVIGNFIGTDATGQNGPAWAKNDYGISFKDDATGNRLEDNVIVNSTLDGVYNKHNYTGPNFVINNRIGVTLSGALAANGNGILLRGQDDTIERNIIAGNTDDGIVVNSVNGSGSNESKRTERNRISQNSFYGNGSLAIDIGPNGVNPNDPGDADTGDQQLLNYPEISSANSGSVSGTACAGCEVEIYNADVASATSPQGRQYLGTAFAAANGTFQFSDSRIVSGQPVTALTIDANDNTSEFAPTTTVAGTPTTVAAPKLTATGARTIALGQPTQFTITATTAGASFAALALPDGLQIDQKTGTVSGTPTRGGQYLVTLTAFNASGSASVTVVWTVQGATPVVAAVDGPIPNSGLQPAVRTGRTRTER